jgi:hypothetical protein
MSVSTLASDFDDKASEPMERLKHSDTSKRKSKSYYNHSRYSSNIFFQICQSCFWCASNLYKNRIIERCPSCKSNKIGSLPVSANGIYTYHYDG